MAQAHEVNEQGYKIFKLGDFTFRRDEYFAHIGWPGGVHSISVENFLRALMRDVAWGFFYGTVSFDAVFGTTNHYGTVEVFVGLRNEAYWRNNKHFVQTFDSNQTTGIFKAILEDWTNEGFDPFAAPEETRIAFGPKHGSNRAAIERMRVTAKRMVGADGDATLRNDANGYKVNRQFAGYQPEKLEVHPEPGFENEVHAFDFFDYLMRSDVTWNPSVVSAVKHNLICATTEEYMLPVIHGNDRVEWFLQLSDQIDWLVYDGKTGKPRARVVAKAGDICAMPADIQHQGISPKRSMLLVWENGDSALPDLYASGKLKPYPVEF
ncbi:MAG: hydroxyquinol 1,2-dioxygenase [Candidatus Binataceae bacterium]|nr:hydroxyquinol 1,2-dioxygenase [Candidatus Binataceae bacterium]